LNAYWAIKRGEGDNMYEKKPEWLKVKLKLDKTNKFVERTIDKLALNTVCKEANCPNRMECFNRGTATFMILGNVCSRNCTFCNVTKGVPQKVDENEPMNVAQAVKALNLKYVVVTSVTRDDLEDGGAEQFVRVIGEIRKLTPQVKIEVLIPDFKGSREALIKVIKAKPEVINHNVETVPNLYSNVRPAAVYERSLELLKRVKEADETIFTKSGIMVGLGEKEEEVSALMKDLKGVQCDILTIGQYLAPSNKHHPVIEYIHPDTFKKYEELGLSLGFKHVVSSPLTRSSYFADGIFKDK